MFAVLAHVTVWQSLWFPSGSVSTYALTEEKGARLLIEQYAEFSRETLEYDGLIWQTHDADPRICQIVDAFPAREPCNVVRFRGEDRGEARYVVAAYDTHESLSPAVLGITEETNVRLNGVTYGLADGALRPWHDHVQYLRERDGLRLSDGQSPCGPDEVCGTVFSAACGPYSPSCSDCSPQNACVPFEKSPYSVGESAVVPPWATYCCRYRLSPCYISWECFYFGKTCESGVCPNPEQGNPIGPSGVVKDWYQTTISCYP